MDRNTIILLTLITLAVIFFLINHATIEKIILIKHSIIITISMIAIYTPPGLAIITRITRNKMNLAEAIIISIPLGILAHIFITYVISILNVAILNIWVILLSILTSLSIINWKNIKPHKVDVEKILIIILLFIVNISSIFYPTNHQLQNRSYKYSLIYPSGDDQKNHIEIVKSILSIRRIARVYSNYPKYKIIYPEGLHLIVSELHIFSKIPVVKIFVPLSVAMILFMMTSICLLYKNKKEIILVLLLFISDMAIVIFLGFGRYSQLFSYLLFPVFIYLFSKKNKIYNMLSNLLSILFMYISPYTFILSSLMIIVKNLLDDCPTRNIVKYLITVLLFSIPLMIINNILVTIQDDIESISRANYPIDTSKNIIYTYTDWYKKVLEYISIKTSEILNSIKDASIVNYPLLIFGILGLTTKNYNHMFSYRIMLISIILSVMIILLTPPFSSILIVLLPGLFIIMAYMPLVFLSESYINRLPKKESVSVLFLILLLSLVSRIERSSKTEFMSLSKGDIELIEFINTTFTNRNTTIFFNDFYRGTSSTLIPPYTNIRVTFPFIAVQNISSILFGDFFLDQYMVRTLPDHKKSLEILSSLNSTHIIFSSYFSNSAEFLNNYTLPKFEEEKFIEPCFSKIYDKYYNHIFRINYNKCTQTNYITLYTNRTNIRFNNNEIVFPVKNLRTNVETEKNLFDFYLMLNITPTDIGYINVTFFNNSFPHTVYVPFYIIENRKNSDILPVKINKNIINNGTFYVKVSGKGFILNTLQITVRSKKYPSMRYGNILIFNCQKSDSKCTSKKGRSLLIVSYKDVSQHNESAKLCFLDTRGSVDINTFENVSWIGLKTYIRNQTYRITCKQLPINNTYNISTLYLVPHDEDLIIYNPLHIKEWMED